MLAVVVSLVGLFLLSAVVFDYFRTRNDPRLGRYSVQNLVVGTVSLVATFGGFLLALHI